MRGVEAPQVETLLRESARLDVRRCLGLRESRRAMMTAWTPSLPGVWVPRVHAVGWHNERVGLLRRVLGPTPGSAEEARGPVLSAFAELRRVASRYDGSRWDYLFTAQSYTGALRRRYLEAERSLREDGPLSSSDWFLRSFLKAEKRHVENCAKPRMIFPRSPRYNLHLASWLKPFEHWLWGNLKSVGSSGVGKSRVVAKGLSPRQRANLIDRKMRAISDCVVFEVDGKAFEAHQDVWQLEQEHSVYLTAYSGDAELRRVLRTQLRCAGVTSGGMYFSREGGRASGDFNTGMGNSLVMLAVVSGTMRELGVRVYDSLVDGDNALLFLPRTDCPRVVREFHDAALRVSGHEIVLERPVDFLEGVRFGQSAPVRLSSGLTMVRDWRKVLSCGTSSHAHLREPRFAREWLLGVSLCELFLAREVPILSYWAESLRRCTETGSSVRMDPHRDYQVLGVPLEGVRSVLLVPPTEVSRLSFERAFGVSPDQQLAMEKWIMQNPPSLGEFSWHDGFDVVHADTFE